MAQRASNAYGLAGSEKNKLRIFLTLLLFNFCSAVEAQQAGEKARLAHSHWECYYLIDFMSEEAQSELKTIHMQHFEKGYNYIKEMHRELKKYGDENDDNWSNNAPTFFTWYMNAPTVEFSAGRLFQATFEMFKEYTLDTHRDKYADVLYSDYKWLREHYVADEYHKQNCKLLN